jgi:hypothetical protein
MLAMVKTATKRRGPPKGSGGRPPIPESERLVDVGLRLKPALIDDLDAIAATLDMERSELMRTMLEEGVAKRKSRPKVRAA